MIVLADLGERYQKDALPYMRMSDRMILEALVHYAAREDLSFADLFQVPQEAAK